MPWGSAKDLLVYARDGADGILRTPVGRDIPRRIFHRYWVNHSAGTGLLAKDNQQPAPSFTLGPILRGGGGVELRQAWQAYTVRGDLKRGEKGRHRVGCHGGDEVVVVW